MKRSSEKAKKKEKKKETHALRNGNLFIKFGHANHNNIFTVIYNIFVCIEYSFIFSFRSKNGTGTSDAGGRGNGHPSDNPFYSNIDSMPDIRPRRKSIPLVSELVSVI